MGFKLGKGVGKKVGIKNIVLRGFILLKLSHENYKPPAECIAQSAAVAQDKVTSFTGFGQLAFARQAFDLFEFSCRCALIPRRKGPSKSPKSC